jgi:hypothetical protein
LASLDYNIGETSGMMRFNLAPEPAEFDQNVRQPGNAWLSQHPDSQRVPSYWLAFTNDLANGFNNLCGYSAMCILGEGTVDHYFCRKNHRDLIYEWSNYRYISPRVNSSKGTLDNRVLDPFEVGDDWFEIILPSLQLVLTDKVPSSERTRAEFTLKRLHLQNGERIMRQRVKWYQMYLNGQITLEGLDTNAPLIARAVRKHQESG